MRQDDERYLLALLARTEIVSTILSLVITIGVLVACWLLDRNHAQLAVLEREMTLRNEQGKRALELLADRNAEQVRQREALEAIQRQLMDAPVLKSRPKP